MKYFYNYEADIVVREDDHGNRFRKSLERPYEGCCPASKDNEEVWGIPSYGRYNYLEEITKEQYDTFGRKWTTLD